MNFIEPSKQFHSSKGTLPQKAVDFWKWAYSDLVQNITRGIVAEYLVACALGLDKTPRQPWESFDLQTKDNKKIEVKSTAYVQAWKYGNSPPRFSISPKKKWTNVDGLSKNAEFNSDIYVLCLHNEKNRDKVDPINIDQWTFWVFSREEIINLLDGKKSFSLKRLESCKNTTFANLAKTISQK